MGKVLNRSADTARDGDDGLIERWVIAEQPSAARLKEYGIDIWALIGAAGGSDEHIEQVARWYDLPVEAVQAAFSYYRRHPEQIEAKLEDNAWGHEQAWPRST